MKIDKMVVSELSILMVREKYHYFFHFEEDEKNWILALSGNDCEVDKVTMLYDRILDMETHLQIERQVGTIREILYKKAFEPIS